MTDKKKKFGEENYILLGWIRNYAVFTITLPLIDHNIFKPYDVTPIPNSINNIMVIMEICGHVLVINTNLVSPQRNDGCTVNKGVISSGVSPSALAKSADGIINEGDYRVCPNPTQSSSVLKTGPIFASLPGSVTSAGVETLTVRSLTRLIVGCPAEVVLGQVTALSGVASDGGVCSVSVSKNSGRVDDMSSATGSYDLQCRIYKTSHLNKSNTKEHVQSTECLNLITYAV
uniref:Uncharacterized protein n=1 Tax=Glossina austeni TaxID=7395 RepID=A0A1A9VL44_GLOAU